MNMQRLTIAVLALTMLAAPLSADPRGGTSGGFSRPSSPPSSSYRPPSTPSPHVDSAPRVESRPPVVENRAPSPAFSRPPQQNQPNVAQPQQNSPPPNTAFSRPPQQQNSPPVAAFSRPGGQQSPGTVSRTASPADTAIAKGQSQTALHEFQASQQKFKAPPVAVHETPQAAQSSPQWRQYGGRWNNADSYYGARQAALRDPRWGHYYEQPPVWVTRPSYGGYSGSFLGGVLLGGVGVAAYDMWAYSHRNDEGYRLWHQDMMTRINDDSIPMEQRAELTTKMSTLDARVAALEAEHAPVSEALPDGIDPSLVVAEHTALLATSHESSSHWILYTILAMIILGVGFVIAALHVSKRRKLGTI